MADTFEQTTLTEENIHLADVEIKVAAKWWADQLRQPADHNNGDAFQSGFTRAVANSVAKPLSPQHVDDFENALVDSIRRDYIERRVSWNLKDPRRGSNARCIGTDYDPDTILQYACEIAGIDHADLRFPIKTTMWIDPNLVEVSCGYGAPFETIYPVAGAEGNESGGK